MITRNPPTPIAAPGLAAREADHDHQTESDAHQGDAGPAVTSGAAALEQIHGPVETARIHLGWRHQAALDHRDPLAHFQLPDPRLRERLDDGVDEGADDGDDRNHERRGKHVAGLHRAP